MTDKPCGASHLQQSSNQCSKSAFKPVHKEGSPDRQKARCNSPKGCNDNNCKDSKDSKDSKGCNNNNPRGCNSPTAGPKRCNNNKKPPKCQKRSSPEYVIPPAYSPAILSIFNNDTDIASEGSPSVCPPSDIEIGTPSEPLLESEAGQPGCFTKEDKKKIKEAKKEIKVREKKNSKKSKEGENDKKAAKKAKVKIKRGSPKPSFWSRFRKKNKLKSPVPPSVSISINTPSPGRKVVIKQTVSDEVAADDDLGSVTSLAASIASFCPDIIPYSLCKGSPTATLATQSYCQCGGSECEAEDTVHGPDCEMINLDPTAQHANNSGDSTSEGQTIDDHGCDNYVTEEDDLSEHEEFCGVYGSTDVSQVTGDQDCVRHLPDRGVRDPTLNIDCVNNLTTINIVQHCVNNLSGPGDHVPINDPSESESTVHDTGCEYKDPTESSHDACCAIYDSTSTVHCKDCALYHDSTDEEDASCDEEDASCELEEDQIVQEQGPAPCCNLFDPLRGITLHEPHCKYYSWPTYYPTNDPTTDPTTTTDCHQEFKMERQHEEFKVRAVSPCYFVTASTAYEVLEDIGEVVKGRETESSRVVDSASFEVAVQTDNNSATPVVAVQTDNNSTIPVVAVQTETVNNSTDPVVAVEAASNINNADIFKDAESESQTYTLLEEENVNEANDEVNAGYKYTVSPDDDSHSGTADEVEQYDAECDLPSTGEPPHSPTLSEESSVHLTQQQDLTQPPVQPSVHLTQQQDLTQPPAQSSHYDQPTVQQPHYENVPNSHSQPAACEYTETSAQPTHYNKHTEYPYHHDYLAILEFTALPELSPLPAIPDQANHQYQSTAPDYYFPTDTIATTIPSPNPSYCFSAFETYDLQKYIENKAPTAVCHLCSNYNRYPTPEAAVCSKCNHNYSAHFSTLSPQRGVISPQAIYPGGMVGSFPLRGGLSSRSRRGTGESTPSPCQPSPGHQRCESVQSVQQIRCESVLSACSELTQYCSYCKAKYHKVINKRAYPRTRLTVIPKT